MADANKSGSVELSIASVESVAFEMVKLISAQERGGLAGEQSKRDYWLKLYAQCLSVVNYGESGLPKPTA